MTHSSPFLPFLQILQKDREIKNLEKYFKEQHKQAEQELALQEEQEKLNLTILSAEKRNLTEKTEQLNLELLTLMTENRKAERILQHVSLQEKFVHIFNVASTNYVGQRYCAIL